MIARVALDIALGKEFDYLIPADLEGQVELGSRVKVPLGQRQTLGSVTGLVECSSQPKLRPIAAVIGQQSLLTRPVLQLARWISEYYCCPLEVALKSVLPEAVRKEEKGWRERLFVRRAPEVPAPASLPKRQRQILDLLSRYSGGVLLQALINECRTTAATVRKLEGRGLVSIAPEISERDPYAHEQIVATKALALNSEQSRALAEIKLIIEDRLAIRASHSRGQAAIASAPKVSPGTFLLHGVTGSGKTEVYLQAIAHCLEKGCGAIVLVPEISLTPQTVERFKARFSAGNFQTHVAVLHSHLSTGERHDEWHKIRQGRARIVIGARSAIFAPVDPLGLIIVDEEHESSYKQEEAPRYHARDVAVKRGQLEGAVVVLGSATPSLESYHNAETGKYKLLEMLNRADDKKLPLVRVIDMRDEVRAGKGPPIFSHLLREAIHQRLEKKEQAILFLNRRGYASALQCPNCGYVAGCPNCSISLTYHRRENQLRCHICGHHETAPILCPQTQCRSAAIRYSGLGTERVEETLSKLFPHAKVRRMDTDTLKRKEDYRRILGDFRTCKIDILVGTQMIAKGLHFPNVTLVGIIYADLSLHMPDFRASERTFQLLTQVSGRAGRGDTEGEVIVQSFTPFHFAIQAARRHDFASFYEQEIEFRKQLRYPPVARVAMLTLKGRNEEKVQFFADHLKRSLDLGLADFKNLIVAGPAPSPLLKAETFYRYQIMLRTPQMARLSQKLAEILKSFSVSDEMTVTVDIDPVNSF